MLEVIKLCKTYSVGNKIISANDDISFSVKKGEMIWIYGNSGSGKSTLLNLLVGLDKQNSGTVEWDNKNLFTMTNSEKADFRLHNCGLIFQFFEMIKTQNIFSNVSIPLVLLKQSKNQIRKTVTSLLEEFKISSLQKMKPEYLSGGEIQRAAIVRSLVNNPEYIIADEITASLDTDMSKYVYERIRSYLKSRNGIGIFVSHDPIIKNYADSIYRMNNGRLEQE